MSDTAVAPETDAVGAAVDVDQRITRANAFGLGLAAVFAAVVSSRSGVGLALTVAVVLLGVASARRFSTSASRWCAATAVLTPWLVVLDNTWVAISIVCTAALVVGLVMLAEATEQSIGNMSLSAAFRRTARPPRVERVVGNTEYNVLAAVRGVLVATPIVAIFWGLLASADDVFAEIADPSVVPFARAALFILALPVSLFCLRLLLVSRPSSEPGEAKRFGEMESTIVLSAVAALFAFFIALRVATSGRELSDAAWRSEVRSGFFQLLWVAALTVLLVLAIRQVSGSPGLSGRLRRLSVLTVGLAAIIDGLAIQRIAEYVERSFLSPLRFWSFGFGLWLLVVLILTALRVSNFRSTMKWFTVALVSSWIVFVFAVAAANPDKRIAEHNFANPPTGEDEWIAVRPLMWLSEDATPTIVENIEVLRPMPNDRYVRVRDHLCSRPEDESWRHVHLSRASAREAIAELC